MVVPYVWNSLPIHIRPAENIGTFKSLLKTLALKLSYLQLCSSSFITIMSVAFFYSNVIYIYLFWYFSMLGATLICFKCYLCPFKCH